MSSNFAMQKATSTDCLASRRSSSALVGMAGHDEIPTQDERDAIFEYRVVKATEEKYAVKLVGWIVNRACSAIGLAFIAWLTHLIWSTS